MELKGERASVGQFPISELVSRVFWALCGFPGAALVLFYSFVLRAYWTLGSWPVPYHPDPKDLNFGGHYYAVGLSFPLVLWAAITLVLLAVLERWVYLQGRYRWGLLFFGITFGVWLLLMRLDPGSFLLWFMD
jgi:hypothetical protein